jgi:hypothetical protein
MIKGIRLIACALASLAVGGAAMAQEANTEPACTEFEFHDLEGPTAAKPVSILVIVTESEAAPAQIARQFRGKTTRVANREELLRHWDEIPIELRSKPMLAAGTLAVCKGQLLSDPGARMPVLQTIGISTREYQLDTTTPLPAGIAYMLVVEDSL